ncbi:hypothetical protein F383_33188 [Gossypium arboreum]|uniref:Uncharacterized protein n=1 Tax=Gossypium arboreum TaxID=29729 RepID=A0A0B0N3B1_GOSAR|nr:hypothetical protein F383_33188 [Gossypium arboreum]
MGYLVLGLALQLVFVKWTLFILGFFILELIWFVWGSFFVLLVQAKIGHYKLDCL